MVKCAFCDLEGDWKNVLRDPELVRKDGKDIILCNICLQLYADGEFEDLSLRMAMNQK